MSWKTELLYLSSGSISPCNLQFSLQWVGFFLFPSFRNKNMLMIQVNTCSLKIHTSRCWDKLLISVWATITRKAERVPHYHIQNTDQHMFPFPKQIHVFNLSQKVSKAQKLCWKPPFPLELLWTSPSFLPFQGRAFPSQGDISIWLC